MFDLLRQAQAMREKMEKFKEELEKATFTGSAGGGAVTVVLNGKHEMQKITLRPGSLQSGDAEKLQDWIRDAVNDAGRQVNEKLKTEVGKVTGGLGLPGLF